MQVTEKWVTQILLAAAMCMPLEPNSCVCVRFCFPTSSLASSKVCGSKDGESQLPAAGLKLRERLALKTELQAVAIVSTSPFLYLEGVGRELLSSCVLFCALHSLLSSRHCSLTSIPTASFSAQKKHRVGILSTGGVYLSVPCCSGLFRLTLLNSEYFRASSGS